MKKIFFSTMVITTVMAISCNSGDADKTKADSAGPKMAEQQNDKKMEATNVDNDADFAVAAADGGMAEVMLGNLAAAHTSNKAVKDLADMIVKDHTAANNELKTTAQQLNITLPTTVSSDHQKKYDELSAKKGADFDKAFVDAMEDGHKKTIDKFKSEAENGKNATLKQWAAAKLPTLQKHLDMVEQTNKNLK